MATSLRLADLLAGLSVVADLGFGLPPQTAMRSCIVATQLARRLNLTEADAKDAYYTSLLMHVGCVAMSHETAATWGDELRMMRAVAETNLADPQDWMETLLPAISAERGFTHQAALLQRHGQEFGQWYDTGSGEIGRETARRLGLPDSTQRAMYEAPEWWDGNGAPQGLKGDDISVGARIARVAEDAAFLCEIGDVDSAVAGVRRRIGILDPEIVETFAGDAAALLADAQAGDPRDRVLELEPHPVEERTTDELDHVARVVGDAVDLKTPYMHDHARRVAELSTAAADEAHLDATTVARLRVAAFLHDVGRVAVSDVIWDKRAPLTAAEREQVQMHAYHSERILGGSETLRPVARLAGSHHERLDGSGYPRGESSADLPMAARILACADAFVAMTQRRPHRPALAPDHAARELLQESRAGRWHPDATQAVLQAAGQTTSRRRVDLRPAGLSDRELEVLALLASGLSNPEIASRLHISRRTAEHHVQHIYAKVGVSTRPGVALFALQHGLLGDAAK